MIQVPEEIVSQLAHAFGTTRKELAYLGGGKEFSDGIVYSFTKDGKAYALKILGMEGEKREIGLKEASERLEFVHFCGEQGVPIVHPIRNPEGHIFEQASHGDKAFIAYVMDKVDGQSIDHMDYHNGLSKNLGRTVGQMHKAAKLYAKWKGQGADGDSEVLGWRQEVDFFIGWCADEDVKDAWRQMGKTLETYPRSRETYGFIHNDMHVGNMVFNSDAIYLLDFDVANYHWFSNDFICSSQHFLWSQCGGFDRPLEKTDDLKRFFDAFLEGYQYETHLDPLCLKDLDMFLNYRRMIIFTAMQDYMNGNPKVKMANKKMILECPAVFDKII
ncbi:MAG: phosphotransferase [Clostridia bacterium]|nr:phosphotransferase [Clostridia bacterium]